MIPQGFYFCPGRPILWVKALIWQMRANRKQTFLQLEDLSGCLIYKAALRLLAKLEAVKRQQQRRRVGAGDDTSKSLIVECHITAII